MSDDELRTLLARIDERTQNIQANLSKKADVLALQSVKEEMTGLKARVDSLYKNVAWAAMLIVGYFISNLLGLFQIGGG